MATGSGVLGTLESAERLAFVLHDVFGLPGDECGNLIPVTQLMRCVGRTFSARSISARFQRRSH